MPNVGSKGIVKYSETFAHDTMSTAAADGIAWVYLSDSDTDWARAVSAAKGLHASAATAATDDHLVELCGDSLQFAAQQGYCMVECLFMLSSVANVAFNFGFSDDVLDDSNTLPCEIATTTITNSCTDGCALLVYDVDATNDDIHCFWANGGTAVSADSDGSSGGKALRLKGAVPVADKWMYLRVELHDRGSGNGAHVVFHFEVDGKTFEREFDTSLDRDRTLCWYLGFENRSASAHTAYLLLPGWEQTIAD